MNKAAFCAGILFLLCFFCINDTAYSYYLDTPHNESNGMYCNACHATPGFYSCTESDIDNTCMNQVCLSCHSAAGTNPYKGSAPEKPLHSALVMSPDNRMDGWTTKCIDCHNPHFQAQLDWNETDSTNLYLVTGKVHFLPPYYVYDPSDGPYGSTTITIETFTTQPGWEDPEKWNAKGGNMDPTRASDASRGLVFVIDRLSPKDTFEIIAADATSIKVKGEVTSLPPGISFALIYGQTIRSYMSDEESHGNGARDVRFYKPDSTVGGRGGFVDDSGAENPTGLCQSCHTQTNHWHADGTRADHFQGEKCFRCHDMMRGFAHGGDGSGASCATSGCHDSNKHPAHLNLDIECNQCHDTANMRDADGNILIDPLTENKCGICHHNGLGGAPNDTTYRSKWDDPAYAAECDSCHNGRSTDTLYMTSNGHDRLISPSWIRQYPCSHCHYDTVDQSWSFKEKHTNGQIDVSIDPQFSITNEPPPQYQDADNSCYNTYCHSDGTTVDPEMRSYPWTGGHEDCNACHGHDPEATDCSTCHEQRLWETEQKWLSAMPMYQNEGPGMPKANSHFRHLFTGFSCDDCHATTVVGPCRDCHGDTLPNGAMTESQHVDGNYHVNKEKTVTFKDGGSYNPVEPLTNRKKTCSDTSCHTGGTAPQWGDSVDKGVVCIDCHSTTEPDVDDFGMFNGTRARFNFNQWVTTGHGRPAASGNYPKSGNPPANFPGNGCWYCHDNNVLHKDSSNPFRLRRHQHFNRRFEKECVYCHMSADPSDPSKLDETQCMNCHNSDQSIAPQLSDIQAESSINPPYVISQPDHSQPSYLDGTQTCASVNCHTDDATRHKTGTDTVWTEPQKDDVRNQYVMMGVCLKCHEDDSGNKCTSCHTAPDDNPDTIEDESLKYSAGFDFDPANPDSRYIKPSVARASSFHFGYKHYRDYEHNGQWKGGKFCWDCHDPHGDSNIYMVHDKLATQTDGTFGKPIERADVVFVNNQSGLDYARTEPPYDGICNVCHSGGAANRANECNSCHDPATQPVLDDLYKVQHYSKISGDGHNAGRRCTECHEHRFTDSHASNRSCDECHQKKPVPRHTAFGLPRDCTKCHDGTIKNRMNIMAQFRAQSHHVQNANGEVNNRHCYTCHWEATEDGLINLDYHQGYNYRTYNSTTDAPVDLVIWGPDIRPEVYDLDGSITGDISASQFSAMKLSLGSPDDADWSTVGLPAERREVENITSHCLGCHSDQNNDATPFDDCKTPRQYAWDGTSVAARYFGKDPQGNETTTWGKYVSAPDAAPKNIAKAYSAHGNAINNGGGYDPVTGIDGSIPNTRSGQVGAENRAYNIQCFDCHSSHGSKVSGITSSYRSFDGEKHGANLKETQVGKGGYRMTYKATAYQNPDAPNFYNPGAGQCFDCHETPVAGETPWGFASHFGASAPILGYRDNPLFAGPYAGKTESESSNPSYPAESIVDLTYRRSRSTMGGHLKASSPLTNGANSAIDGLCTPCHDPHGVSPTLGDDMQYGVPLLKGTWLTSPYKEDHPPPPPYGPNSTTTGWGNGSYRGWPATGTPENHINIDRTLFGDPTNSTRISEDQNQFAGLCLRCHPRENLQNANPEDRTFRSIGRIHESVKNWGENVEHSYPCSKCHKPHSSGLPRLLRTNCLNFNHRGGVVSGGIPDHNKYGTQHRGYPIANILGNNAAHSYDIECHIKVDEADQPDSTWPNKQIWREVEPW